MCVPEFVNMYACVWMYVHVWMNVHAWVCECVFTRVWMCVPMYVWKCVRVCECIYIYVPVCVNVCAWVCECVTVCVNVCACVCTCMCVAVCVSLCVWMCAPVCGMCACVLEEFTSRFLPQWFLYLILRDNFSHRTWKLNTVTELAGLWALRALLSLPPSLFVCHWFIYNSTLRVWTQGLRTLLTKPFLQPQKQSCNKIKEAG